MNNFSEKSLQSLNGYYVYALIDPRTNNIFYIGKGIGDRVFNHEIESGNNPESEKRKLQTIRAIERENLQVKRVIINWGLTEEEAFAAEASLINLLNFTKTDQLTNIVAGHHVHESLTVEDFELLHGAEPLSEEDVKHNILVIKINKRYSRGISEQELYDAVRGIWRASMNSIINRKIEYVFGVYNQLIVAVYKPDAWHYVHEMIDVPRPEELTDEIYEKAKDRIYFTCKDYTSMDSNQQYYLHKSIANLKINQASQNPISYLMPVKENNLQKFAKKWLDKFQNPNTDYLELVGAEMADELEALGFLMDCGHSFTEAYGQGFDDTKYLSRIVDNITDISLLGSAIYSKWRYFNHWAYSGEEILAPQNKQWFLLALTRLLFLSKESCS